MSRRRNAYSTAAALAAAVLQHSKDEAARALAQLVVDLQPDPRPLRRRARARSRRIKVRLQRLAELAGVVEATAAALQHTQEEVDALLVRAAATKTALCEDCQERRRLAQEREVRAGWAIPQEPRA